MLAPLIQRIPGNMIIFNLWAIPVAIVIYLLLLGLEHFFPALMTSPRTGWTIGIVATSVGAVSECVGLRGRVFFLPIWTIGLGIICYQLGWPGTVAFIAIAVGGLVWVFISAKKKEVSDWQQAQQEIAKAPAPPAVSTERQFWEWVKSTLFLPVWMDFTLDLCEHNLRVLHTIKKARPQLSPDENGKIEALERFLMTAKAASKPPGSEVKVQTAVCELVEKKLKKARPNAPLQSASAPPPIPGSP